MTKVNNMFIPRPNINPQKPVDTKQPVNSTGKGLNFQDILNQKLGQNEELKISKHAEQRLRSRNINLSSEQMDRIKSAVEKAEQKGVKESLVLVDDIAMVVSVKNKTIITAVDSKELKENVFTNIDGAVII